MTVIGLPAGFFLFKFPKLGEFLMHRLMIFFDGDDFLLMAGNESDGFGVKPALR